MTTRINNVCNIFYYVSGMLFAAFFIIIPYKNYCQPRKVKYPDKSVTDTAVTFVTEKIFVHTDKSLYQPNEIIWLKCYVTEALSNKPIDISKIVYVELLNQDGKPVLQGKIAMERGLGNGSFVVPPYVVSGNYLLRAYTNWMKNTRPDNFFEKPVVILNAQRKPPRVDHVNHADSLFISFFPEGGNLVNNLSNTVAFQLTNKYGKGVNADVVLLNQNNDTITRFKPLRFGLGHFAFTPKAGEMYSAVIEDYQYPVRFSLPPADNTGIVMHLTDSTNGRVNIHVSTNLYKDGTSVYIIGRRGNSIQFTQEERLHDNSASFTIDKAILADGINVLTVLDDRHNPVCERLYFKRPRRTARIKIDWGANEFSNRQKIDLDISAFNDSLPIENGNFSLSVSKNDSFLNNNDDADISSYLWLDAELKGKIENPGSYLAGENDVDEATNNLVMTHGWRKLIAKHEDSASSAFLYLPEYAGASINVKVSDKNTGSPVSNVPVYLSIPDKSFQFYTSLSDTTGICRFIVNNFFGGGEVVLQTNPNECKDCRLEILPVYSTASLNDLLPPLLLQKNVENELNEAVLYAHVQQAFSGTRLSTFYVPNGLDTIPFFGKGDNNYLLDDYTRFTTMEEVMREYVTEVQVRKTGGKFHFKVRNTPYKLFFDNDPLVLIDGVPVFDVDKIMQFDPLKIKSLSVTARTYYLSGRPFEGILSYKTYNGDMAGFELRPSAIVFAYEGVQLQRQFYSPAYDTKEAVDSRLPDMRNVLFWSPDIYTDSKGKAHVSFYASDLPGDYNVKLQGITGDGLTASGTVSFRVNGR